MKIKEVYEKYSIPSNLAEHMLTVTKVAVTICNHWVGEHLDTEAIKRSALVHDLGNIVRFDFEKHPEFLGEEIGNIKLWREKQKEIIEKYGSDDHEVTRQMLKELSFSDDSIEVVSSKSFINSVAVLNSENWNLKILLYADMRVSPNGVISLNDRLSELLPRRPDLTSRIDIDELCSAIKNVEKQIQESVNTSLNDLTLNEIGDRDLLNTEI